jgi:acyl-CoA synthetase (AMP-forming)/AMP-acid ligase II
VETLPAKLVRRAREAPARPAVTFLDAAGNDAETLTAAALLAGAGRFAAAFAAERGRPVLVAAEPTAASVEALCGCLLAGAIAVPVPAALRPRAFERIAAVAAGGEAVADTGAAARRLAGALGGLRLLAPVTDATPAPIPVAPATPALLQHTSGSTSAPKGVVVTHRNLEANLAMLAEGFGANEHSRIVSWLPLHHDMGLVAQLLLALDCGAEVALMAPLAFVRRPEAWLRAVARERATIAGGPDFAYDLCTRRVRPEMLEGLDFSAWRVAFCGAEPVRPAHLRRFAALLAPHGFDASALLPCYGLAEATVYVSGGPPGGGLKTRLSAGREVAGCGRPAGKVAIVDPANGAPLPEGAEGEIRVEGEHVTAGPALRTGDLGFLANGELFVTGRIKDLIIHRGENLHPADIEATILAADPALGPAGAVFAVDGEDGEEVVAVVEARRAAAGDALRRIALRAVAETHGVRLRRLLLVPPGRVPRTTSGKVRRAACRELYRAGALDGGAPAAAAAAEG